MKKINIIMMLAMTVSGCSVIETKETEIVSSGVVRQAPVFERGVYYRTKKGYYISNLSPRREEAQGCSIPILTTDLSLPVEEGEKMAVKQVEASCDS